MKQSAAVAMEKNVPGSPETILTKSAEVVSHVAQTFQPLKGIHMHLCGHIYINIKF